MSQLYEARHEGHRRQRYLVEVLDGLVGLPAALAAFERDVGLASSPPHPYVLPVHEMSYLPDGTPLAVSELPEGQTLEHWLAGNPQLSQITAVGLVMALADVLTEMHERGVSHGALSPDQVLLVAREGCAVGLPRLHGFGFGWLRGASDRRMELPDAIADALRRSRKRIAQAERGADLAALATLARRLMAAAAWAAPDEEDGDVLGGRRRVAMVLSRALRPDALESFATPLSFAMALESALAPPETVTLAAMPPRGQALPAGAVMVTMLGLPAQHPAAAASTTVTGADQREGEVEDEVDEDDEPLVPARNPRLALAATAVVVVALVAGLVAWAPTTVWGRGAPPSPTSAAPAPVAPVMLATAPPPADPVDTAYLDDLVAPASAVSPTPEPTAPRARTLPRAKRGIVWSARLGRVVAIEEDVVDDAAAVPGDPTR
jgi:hypothetical protein